MCCSVLGTLQLIPKGGASGECALLQHFLDYRNHLMPFGRTTEAEFGLDGADLSLLVSSGPSYCPVQCLPLSLHSHPVGLHLPSFKQCVQSRQIHYSTWPCVPR